MTLKEYCKDNRLDFILREWDAEKNGVPIPDTLPAFSGRPVWWKCSHGHPWQARVRDRASRMTGCPYCAGKLPIKGETDLATLYPGLAAQWHPTKNGSTTPEDVAAGSDKPCWWQCGEGHEWAASVGNRALKGTGCPYCTGKKAWPGYNDLATLYPDLMEEWLFERNGEADPSRIRPGSGKKVSWMCPRGHVWEAYVYNRTSKKRTGCPVCAGNVKKAAGARKGQAGERGRA